MVPPAAGQSEHRMRKNHFSEDAQDLKGLRILLAEDNVANQLLVIEMLRLKEIKVTAVENGAYVLEALERNQYDLILMDIQMPIMDGLEATKRIRESQNPIPIIALTGSVLPQDKHACINNGANEVVEKPIYIDILLEKIRLVLNLKPGNNFKYLSQV